MKKIAAYIPLIGMFQFILCVLIAILNFPCFGMCELSFDWQNTYWCNLISSEYKGQANQVQQLALSTWIILCLSLIVFWWNTGKINKTSNSIIGISGSISMLLAIFIFGQWHDTVIVTASIFGAIAIGTLIYNLWQNSHGQLALYGANCFLLSIANFLIYFSGEQMELLPTLQKVTFLLYFIWFILLQVEIVKATSLQKLD